MLYTPSHAELAQHPKTRKLARLLGVSIPTAIGHLHLLWHFALKYAPDGDLSRFADDDIADGCMWDGPPETMLDALESSGWLDSSADARRVHDWEEYGGKLVNRREANASRMRESRAKQPPRTKEPRATHVQRTSTARVEPEESRGEESRGEKTRGEGVRHALRATPAPDDFPISEDMRSWADEHAAGVDIDAETTRFLDRNRASGTTYKDWQAAWRNWITSPYAKTPIRVNGRSPTGPSLAAQNAAAAKEMLRRKYGDGNVIEADFSTRRT